MTSNIKLLILEDNPDDAAFIKVTLKRAGLNFNIKLVSTREEFIEALDSFIPEIIVSDHQLPGFISSEALELCRRKFPHIPFILVTGTVSEEFAVEIIKSGADDYILKDRMARLPAAINAALKRRRMEKEKQETVEKLIQSETRLKEAQAIAHISNWEIDLTNGVNTWSDEFYRIYGLTREEVDPSPELFLSLMHPDDFDFAKKNVEEAFASCTDSSFNFRFIRKDGVTRYGSTEWRFEFGKKQRPVRLFGILQDITERKEAEEKLKLLQQEILNQKIQEQKKITRAIIKAQEGERNFIGRELHDNITQILAGTKMYLGIGGKKDEKVKEVVTYPMELIDSAIGELRKLSSKMVTPRGDINLQELIQALLHQLEEISSIKTTLKYKMAGIEIDNDLKLNIYRIIQEQVNNITKYAEPKTVSVSIDAVKQIINIIVKDDGKGFDIKKKRKGIGISNMINRAESFNGKVIIQSSPGAGCCVQVVIPCE